MNVFPFLRQRTLCPFECLQLWRPQFTIISIADALFIRWAIFQVDAYAHRVFSSALRTRDIDFIVGHLLPQLTMKFRFASP
jgi:hypothetical protein